MTSWMFAEESWIISLTRRPDRLARAISSCFRHAGIQPHVFPAFDGRVLQFENPKSKSCRTGEWLPLRPVETACSLSHSAILRQAYGRKLDSILIMEDDVILAEDFLPEFMHFWVECPKDMGMVWGPWVSGKMPPMRISGRVQMHRYSWMSIFTIYKRRAIEAIVEEFDRAEANLAWDEWIMLTAPRLNLRIYGPRKRIVWPYDHNGDTDIGLPPSLPARPVLAVKP